SYAGASKLRVMSAQTQALSFAANTSKMEMIPSSLLTNAGPYVATSKWKIDAYFNSNAQSTARLSSISKFNPVICHYALSGGKKSESITVHMAVLYPDGTFYSGIRDEKLVSGDTGWVGWENSIYADPAYGSAGTLTLYFYDENGALIGSASITITD
ncbi:MAG: hypothetical protein IJ926_07035, partial [Firmicutes bacterium]|nr:hypothetical protein [Bacillota bacterium]